MFIKHAVGVELLLFIGFKNFLSVFIYGKCFVSFGVVRSVGGISAAVQIFLFDWNSNMKMSR